MDALIGYTVKLSICSIFLFLNLTGPVGCHPLFEKNQHKKMPFIGGDNFIFFSPIFNFADAAISCGVIILLLFYKKYSSDSIHMIKNDLKSKF